jgi:hypothetical protein
VILLQALAVFAAVFVADLAWARYTVSVAAGRRQPAAAWSAAIVVLGAVSLIGYAHNPLLVLPAAAGAYLGTWVAMRGGHS